MSVLNRIILFFYSLAFGAVSLLAIGLFTRVFPDARIWNEFLYLCSRWEAAASAGAALVFSLYLLIQSVSVRSRSVSAGEAMIVAGKMGDVRISLTALKNMADRIARSVYGVRDVKVGLKMMKASSKDKTLIPDFKLRLIVGEEKNVVSISDDIKYQIKTYLNDFIGIEKANIDVRVTNISDSADKNKKRVV